MHYLWWILHCDRYWHNLIHHCIPSLTLRHFLSLLRPPASDLNIFGAVESSDSGFGTIETNFLPCNEKIGWDVFFFFRTQIDFEYLFLFTVHLCARLISFIVMSREGTNLLLGEPKIVKADFPPPPGNISPRFCSLQSYWRSHLVPGFILPCGHSEQN